MIPAALSMSHLPLMASASFNRPLCRRAFIAVCSAMLTIYMFLFTRPQPYASTSHSSFYIPLSSVGNKFLPNPFQSKPAAQQSTSSPLAAAQEESLDDEEDQNHPNTTGNSSAKDQYSSWQSEASYLLSHGSTTCVQPLSRSTHSKARTTRHLCDVHSPFNLTEMSSRNPRIALVTAHYGSDRSYEPALLTHILHGLIHEHEVHVLCDPIVDAIWNKPAFLLKLMMEEMMKPEEDRLEWIFWADRDTMILDQCRPISSFLPPKRSSQDAPRPTPTPGFFARLISMIGLGAADFKDPKDLHLLISNDKNGLNAGTFLLRVSHTSIAFLTAILSYPTHHPKTRLRFKEQTAMSLLISTPEFRPHTQIVPQHWFNSYTYTDRDEKGNNRGYKGDEGSFDSGATVFAERKNTTGLEGGFKDGYVRRGDFLVHFAGNTEKEEDVKRWAEMLEKEGAVWESERGVQRHVDEEMIKFWKDLGY